jgi:tripeptide aminopeptidase
MVSKGWSLMKESVLDRFLRYVKIDTQSARGVKRFPSTAKQQHLLTLLQQELTALGLEQVELDEHGYLTAALPANLPPDSPCPGKVPIIAFMAHVDTYPDVPGADVKPVVHRNYQGGDIRLPGDSEQVIREVDNPALAMARGLDIVTSDGTTLLGADDKAGVAEIMTAMDCFLSDLSLFHGPIKVVFTPDEEIGQSMRFFDVEKLGADFAYTVDGGIVGEIEDETFNANEGTFAIRGRIVHPGYAKGKMVNALRVAADIISRLPLDIAPENTENREGYLHPYVAKGTVEKAIIQVRIRDFDLEGLEEKGRLLAEIRTKVARMWPGCKIELEITKSYRNMRSKLHQDPRVVDYAVEAIRRAGIVPCRRPFRGGTDGARLCYMGLLTPNIFTGGANWHSKLEWIPVQWMEAAVRTIIQLARVWVEESA